MAEKPLHATYMVHRRSEHEYREWIVMPATGVVPVNVWTRYLNKEGARPVWRGSRKGVTADAEMRNSWSTQAMDALQSTIHGHERQNARNPDGRLWVWDEPIVVECTAAEALEYALKTPYPVLNRIKRVLAKRAVASAKNAEVAEIVSLLSGSHSGGVIVA